MNADKENFLLKGYFKRKERTEEKTRKDSIGLKAEDQKVIDKLKK